MTVIYSGAPNGVTFPVEMEMKLGGSYMATVVRTAETGKETDYQVGFHEITSPNSVHMLW